MTPGNQRRGVHPAIWIGATIGTLALLCCGIGAVGSMLDDDPTDPPKQVAAAPAGTPTSTPTTEPAAASTAPPVSAPTSPPPPASPSPVYYANCDAARAAGAAPIRRGQPGYRPPLDRDSDGVACESSEGGSTGGGSTGGGSTGGGSTGGGGTDPRFSTCAAAKAAGYGPYVRGRDPEYEWYRDADRDGTVCE